MADKRAEIDPAAYAIAVRSSEYPVPEELLEDIVRRCVGEVGRHERDVDASEY